jgi:hypothetical protein
MPSLEVIRISQNSGGDHGWSASQKGTAALAFAESEVMGILLALVVNDNP